MKVIIDATRHFICESNEINEAYISNEKTQTVDVPVLPDKTKGRDSGCYILNEDLTWSFDEELYEKHKQEEEERTAAVLAEVKEQVVAQSKTALEEYLASHPIISTCHGGKEASYSITSEKQQHLASMIMTASVAASAGIAYQPSWNASGEACTYDWTLTELQQLALEMEEVVRPLVSKQQAVEVKIRRTKTLDELLVIRFDYGEELKNETV